MGYWGCCRAYRVAGGVHRKAGQANICSHPRYAEEVALSAREALGHLEGRVGSAVRAEERTLPLVAPLADLFPGRSLRRGSTVVVGRGAFPGATSLAVALLSGPCAGGSWCAVVGMAGLGLVAAAQQGLDLERVALVPSPGAKWPVVTAALLEGFDVVLVCPAGPRGPLHRPPARSPARERGSVLAVMGQAWPGSADIRLGIMSGVLARPRKQPRLLVGP